MRRKTFSCECYSLFTTLRHLCVATSSNHDKVLINKTGLSQFYIDNGPILVEKRILNFEVSDINR